MSAREPGIDRNGSQDVPGQETPGAEPTAVLPETAAQLVEVERLQQALAECEERAKNHWDQYLRPGEARGDAGAAVHDSRAQFGAAGGAAGL